MNASSALARWCWVSLCWFGCGCSKSLSESECAALLDEYTARLLRDENPKVNQQTIVEKQVAARELARTDASFDFRNCPSRVSRAQFECAMAANGVDGFEQCLIW